MVNCYHYLWTISKLTLSYIYKVTIVNKKYKFHKIKVIK